GRIKEGEKGEEKKGGGESVWRGEKKGFSNRGEIKREGGEKEGGKERGGKKEKEKEEGGEKGKEKRKGGGGKRGGGREEGEKEEYK
ncbi:hypothetical protein, partial [Streptococcus pyogenes]|uniref:hypothetical protein n=1 Tax=Streptococcus pyogenes TaxID=1314 RepID=UPI001CA3065E